jgi:hypothetical protein
MPQLSRGKPLFRQLIAATARLSNSTGDEVKDQIPDEVAIAARNVMYPLYAEPGDRLKQSLWYALPAHGEVQANGRVAALLAGAGPRL